MSKNEKLKIGLMLDSTDLESWMYSIIERLNRSDYAEVVLVVNNASGSIHKSKWHRLKSNISKVFYYSYSILDRCVFKLSRPASLIVNCESLLSGVKQLQVFPERTKICDYLIDDDIKEIERQQLDIIIRFGFRFLKGDILKAAKYGVWSYHHADNDINRGGPAGYWEVTNKWHVTGTILQVLNEDLDGGGVLYKSWASTNKFSPYRNINQCLWKSVPFVDRVIKQIYFSGEEGYQKVLSSNKSDTSNYSNPLYKAPQNLEAIKHQISLISRMAQRFIEKIVYKDQWSLYFINKVGNDLSLRNFKLIAPPVDRFWADPFLVTHNEDRDYVFLEEYLHSTKKAHISVMEIFKDGSFSKPEPILITDYHLSYPFIIQDSGKYYMVPESSENNTVDIYECVDFPYKWEYKMTLMNDIKAVDATLFKHDGLWWMFASVCEVDGAPHHDELCIFYSSELFSSEWTRHPMNPVLSDVRVARPAGAVFHDGKSLIRPSQDCSVRYGYGVNFNRIDELTTTTYAETLISKIEPNWVSNLFGTHTFTQSNNLTMVDGLVKRKRFK